MKKDKHCFSNLQPLSPEELRTALRRIDKNAQELKKIIDKNRKKIYRIN